MSRLISIACISLVACGGPVSNGDDVEDPTPDAAVSMQQLDPMDCTAFAQSLASAAQTCGTSLPSGGQAAFEGWCKKGVMSADLCGGDPAAGLDCFATQDANDWVCLGAEPYPACNGDLGAALGAYCLIALGNPSCATGVKCTYDVDCSDGLVCNSATDQCMDKTAYCVGLPCTYDVDCPDGHRCNSAEGACIGE